MSVCHQFLGAKVYCLWYFLEDAGGKELLASALLDFFPFRFALLIFLGVLLVAAACFEIGLEFREATIFCSSFSNLVILISKLSTSRRCCSIISP